MFQQLLPAPDAELFHRLTTQAGKGDAITVTTEWTGDQQTSYLSDFASRNVRPETALEILAA